MKSRDYPYLNTAIYDNFYELLKARYEESREVTAISFFRQKELCEISYGRLIQEISSVFMQLQKMGICNQHIGLFLENRYEYLVIYLACIFGNVAVPLDKEMDVETLAQCMQQFDVKVVFCSDKTKEKVDEAAGLLQAQQEVQIQQHSWTCVLLPINVDEQYKTLIAACGALEQEKQDKQVPAFFAQIADTDKDRFAVLASTSGTDGKLKGVMLSQYNIITNIRGTLENNVLGNPTFAFLPMNHTYGMNPCILATFYNGTTVCLSSGMKYFSRDLKAFNPDFFGAVPMVIESIYENILKEAKRQKKDKKLQVAIRLSQFLRFFHIDIRHRLFGNLLCSNLTKIVNGGAPLNPYYVKKFDEIGIKILNGYGLTECSPTVAVSREFNNVLGSAGTIMKHIDVKIAKDGEILVSGPNVMLGYYKDEEATRACMQDGYLRTGDIGYTLGRVLFVTGRKKNLIVLENGKKAAPEMIEEKLNVLPYVSDSLVVARKVNHRNMVITALIRFAPEWEENEAEALLKEDIRKVNQCLPSYMSMEDYEIMKEDFVKTGTMKIKRNLYT